MVYLCRSLSSAFYLLGDHQLSTLSWIEKALVRGDYPTKEFTNHHRFVKKYCSYHKLDNYFKDLDGQNLAEIDYEGVAYKFEYRNERFTIEIVI